MSTHFQVLAPLTLGLLCSWAAAQEPASPTRVLITHHGAKLKVGDQVKTRLDMGAEFRVQQTKDGWYGGAVMKDGKWATGWVAKQHTVATDKALAHFDAMVRTSPRSFTARMVKARLLRDGKQYDEALAEYGRAIQIRPQQADGYNHRGYVHYLKKEHEKAIADYSRAISHNKKDALAYTNRGNNFEQLGRFAEALADYDAAVAVEKSNALAWNNRAWLLATCRDEKVRDPAKAVQSAEQACSLTGQKNATYLDTLAAAYAAKGEFPAAISTIEKALAITPKAQQAELETRRKLYQAKKPFVQP